MLRLNNPKGAFTAAGSRLSIRRKAGPMGQLAVVRFCRRVGVWVCQRAALLTGRMDECGLGRGT